MHPSVSPASSAEEEVFPRSFGSWELLEVAGRGGMGTVYRARHCTLERIVAIKCLHGTTASLHAQQVQILSEARTIALLEHPHIVRLYSVSTVEGQLCIEMEWVSGGTLAQRLSLGRPDRGEALGWLEQVSEALEAAHAAEVVHADIKPANVLLGADNRVRVADFGLAGPRRHLEQGGMRGTPAWMAPELWRGQSPTPASDLYALGVTAYQLLAGVLPYQGDSGELAFHHAVSPVPDPRARVPDLPQRLVVMLERLLAKDPLERPTATQLRALLQENLSAWTQLLSQQESPFQGLKTLELVDAPTFFGRERFIERLEALVAEQQRSGGGAFLAVLGPSGSGKSSALLAGLLPRLLQQQLRAGSGRGRSGETLALPGDETLPQSVSPAMTPTWEARTPPEGLQPTESQTGQPLPASQQHPLATMGGSQTPSPGWAVVRPGPQPLSALARALGIPATPEWIAAPFLPDRDLPRIVIIEPLEALFTPNKEERSQEEGSQEQEERMRLLELLLGELRRPGSRLTLLVSLRSDLLPLVQTHPELARRLSEQGVVIPPMSEAELRQVINGPAQQVGLPFEEGLISLLLEQVRGRSGVLPLLAFTLNLLWEARRQGLNPIAHLLSLGGVGGALAQVAEQITEGLDAAQQLLTQRIFLSLVSVEGASPTRRRRSLASLLPEVERSTVRALVEVFCHPAARLLLLEEATLTVDLAHEALLEHWKRLHDWVEEARADLRFGTQLEREALDWSLQGHPSGLLWRPPRLAALDTWLGRNFWLATPEVRAFAEASLKLEVSLVAAQTLRMEAEKRQLAAQRRLNRRLERRNRVLTVGVLVLLLLLSLIVLLSRQLQEERDEAARARTVAEEQARSARAAERVARAQDVSATQPEVGLSLALEAWQESPSLGALAELARALANQRLELLIRPGENVLVQASALSKEGRLALGLVGKKASETLTGPVLIRKSEALTWLSEGTGSEGTGSDGTVLMSAQRAPFVLTRSRREGSSWRAEVLPDCDGEASEALIGLWPHPVKSVLGVRLGTTLCVYEHVTAATPPPPRRLSHPEPVSDFDWDPQAPALVTVTAAGALQQWTLEGRPGVRVALSAQPLSSVHFSPSGQTLLVTGNEARPWLLDRAGKTLARLEGHSNMVLGGAFSPQGQHLLTWGVDGSARVWTSQGQPVARVARGQGMILHSVWNPSGQSFVTGDVDGFVEHWRIDGTHLGTLWHAKARIRSLHFAQDGRRVVATAGEQGCIVHTAPFRRSSLGLPARPKLAGWSDKARALLVHLEDGSVGLWRQALSGAGAGDWRPLQSEVEQAEWSPDGRWLAMQQHPLHPLSPRRSPGAVPLRPDRPPPPGDTGGAAALGERSTIQLFPMQGGETLTLTLPALRRMAFRSDGKGLAALTHDNRLYRWLLPEPAAGAPTPYRTSSPTVLREPVPLELVPLEPVTVPPGQYNDLAWSAETDGLVLVGEQTWWRGPASDWQAPEGAALSAFQRTQHVQALPGGRTVTSSFHALSVLDAQGRFVCFFGEAQQRHLERASGMALDPRGDLLATSSWDQTGRLWSMKTCALVAVLEGHGHRVTGVRWSPQGDMLLTTSRDGTARLWSRDGQALQVYPTGEGGGWVLDAWFDQDQVLVLGGDGLLQRWSVSPAGLVAEAQARLAPLQLAPPQQNDRP